MKKQFQTLSVGIDGSKRATNAFRAACQFFKNSQYFNHLVVIHIFDPNKNYLPHQYTPDVLRQSMRNSLLSRFQSDKYQLLFQKKEKSTKEDAMTLAHKVNSKMFVVGFNGRKGDKGFLFIIRHITILGSVVSNAAYSNIPLMIIKEFVPRNQTNQKGYFFCVCVDGSVKSFHGLNFIKKLWDKELDTIIIIFSPHFSTSQQHIKKIEKTVQQQMSSQKNWKFKVLDAFEYPYQKIIQFINQDPNYIFHFTVFGNNGQRAQKEGKSFLGNSAEKFLHKLDSNIIFIPQ